MNKGIYASGPPFTHKLIFHMSTTRQKDVLASIASTGFPSPVTGPRKLTLRSIVSVVIFVNRARFVHHCACCRLARPLKNTTQACHGGVATKSKAQGRNGEFLRADARRSKRSPKTTVMKQCVSIPFFLQLLHDLGNHNIYIMLSP